MTSLEKISPADLKVGDLVEQLDVDLDFVYLPVTSIEKVRASGSTTRYKVFLEIPEDDKSYLMVGSRQKVTVKRTAPEEGSP